MSRRNGLGHLPDRLAKVEKAITSGIIDASSKDLENLRAIREECEKLKDGDRNADRSVIRRIADLKIQIPRDKLTEVFPNRGMKNSKIAKDEDSVPLGKAMLLGTDWQAEMSLAKGTKEEPTDRSYLEAYLGMKAEQKQILLKLGSWLKVSDFAGDYEKLTWGK